MVYKILAFLIVLCLYGFVILAQNRPEWDDLSVFKVNVEEPHTKMMVYADAEQAVAGDPSKSP